MSRALTDWLPFRRQACDDCGMPSLKKTKQTANYRAGSDDARCYGCRFYQYGACSLVEGVIEAGDLCDLYEVPVQTYPEQTMGYVELAHVAANGQPWRLFIQSAPVRAAEPPATIPLLPKPGRYQHPAWGVIELTPERIANFVANINAKVYQDKIPIDAEHETKLSGAVGYFSAAVVNDDGSADAVVEWTDRGKALLEADAYQYVSPEWYEAWTDPAPGGATYRDVVIGLALTNNPFFKDKALRPLVAREGTLYAPQATKEVGAHVTESIFLPLQPVAGKDRNVSDAQQMSEEVARQFTELNAKLAAETEARQAAESAAQTFADRIAKIEQAALVKSFVDEVRGRSDANDIPYVGDVQYHVETLEALPVERRAAYMERERAIAKAARAEAAGLFRELGSDAHAPADTAEQAVATRAKAIAAAEGITPEQAYVKAMSEPDLRSRLAAERRGGN